MPESVGPDRTAGISEPVPRCSSANAILTGGPEHAFDSKRVKKSRDIGRFLTKSGGVDDLQATTAFAEVLPQIEVAIDLADFVAVAALARLAEKELGVLHLGEVVDIG